jgi:hypothetical protein
VVFQGHGGGEEIVEQAIDLVQKAVEVHLLSSDVPKLEGKRLIRLLREQASNLPRVPIKKALTAFEAPKFGGDSPAGELAEPFFQGKEFVESGNILSHRSVRARARAIRAPIRADSSGFGRKVGLATGRHEIPGERLLSPWLARCARQDSNLRPAD